MVNKMFEEGKKQETYGQGGMDYQELGIIRKDQTDPVLYPIELLGEGSVNPADIASIIMSTTLHSTKILEGKGEIAFRKGDKVMFAELENIIEDTDGGGFGIMIGKDIGGKTKKNVVLITYDKRDVIKKIIPNIKRYL